MIATAHWWAMPASGDNLLILGGTGEAVQLAQAATDRFPDLAVVSSLAGRTENPILPPSNVRIGGFGGAEGLLQYLVENRVSLLINATHPYAAEIGRNALEAQRRANVPLLRLLRPAWQKEEADIWIRAASAQAAVPICRSAGRKIFLALGTKDVSAFTSLSQCRFLVRMVDAPRVPLPLQQYETIAARGPFSLVDERRLLMKHNIDLLVTKNSGGAATYAKIAAARELRIPVVMIERPKIAEDPGCETVKSVEESLAWIAMRLDRT
ncbi:MAG TPA: cobalt-precorrin-6A reductase [Dongiaceae bacterium]|jgi:precorrin-6A/cobalt-precorrin-6A reductase